MKTLKILKVFFRLKKDEFCEWFYFTIWLNKKDIGIALLIVLMGLGPFILGAYGKTNNILWAQLPMVIVLVFGTVIVVFGVIALIIIQVKKFYKFIKSNWQKAKRIVGGDKEDSI